MSTPAQELASAPVRPVKMWNPSVVTESGPGGALYVRAAQTLGPYPARLTDRLEHWAKEAPDRVFMAQRNASGAWRTLTYSQTRDGARRIAQALLDRGLTVDRPVAILSTNDLEQIQLSFGAMYAGIPFAPISAAYSLLSTDFGKLRYIVDLLTPGLIFVSDTAPYRKALEAVAPKDCEIVATRPGDVRATPFSALASVEATAAVDRSHAAVGPDTIAKILFTSGSTGQPKGVINTHRMWVSNQEMIRTVLAFVDDEPPVICDWLPWNHTFAGNHDVGMILYNGGSYYIDEGKPTPAGMEASVRNLNDVRPNVYLNVPKGFESLLPFLRERPEFRRNFFSRLKMYYYAGASLSQPVWDELQRLAVEATGERLVVFTGLGSTETGPSAMYPGSEIPMAGFVGYPGPGVELKLVPAGEKLEMRLRGPSITPGYWRQPELTAAAFDEEGFYKIGDALKFLEPGDASKGFVFDGRTMEDFKLATGTFVSVGPLRAKFLAACQPWAQDIVIAGHDSDFVSALIFPNLEACRELAPECTPGELVSSAAVRTTLQSLLNELAASATGSSGRIARAILLETPPSIDTHEITDKGSINQGAVLRNRAKQVAELYATPPPPHVLIAKTR